MNVVCIDNVHWHALRFGFNNDFPNLQLSQFLAIFPVNWTWETDGGNEANRNAVFD